MSDLQGSVRHRPDLGRYEWVVDDGDPPAIAEYVTDGDVVVMHHTYTEPRFRGRGLAAHVVEGALDDLRARGLRVRPDCWFVAEYIDEHPEYRDLLAG